MSSYTHSERYVFNKKRPEIEDHSTFLTPVIISGKLLKNKVRPPL